MLMCPECREAARRWSEYTPPRLPRIANGSSRDDTAAGLRDRTAARREERQRLVATQVALIRGICARRHGGGGEC